MEVRLLGPVEVVGAAGPVDVGRPRQRTVLAALAVDAGRVVPVDVLVDRVWGQQPPAGARRALQAHLSRLRRAIGTGAGAPAALHRRADGYVLEVDPDAVDLHRWRRLTREGRDAGRSAQDRLEALRTAMDLWRGRPLAGLTGEWTERVRRSWLTEQLDTAVAWAGAELAAGDPAAAVGPLSDLAEQHPLAEPLAAALLRALAAVGRGADALDRYAALHRRLADELGLDPGPELRAVHRAILRGELPPAAPLAPAPAAGAPAAGDAPARDAPAGDGRVRPAQLPRAMPGFAGRTAELARLDELLAAADPAAPVVVALAGTAGVGKTTLAVHWAHRVAGRFPDGQLHADLRGFHPGGQALDPAEAVRGFLAGLGVPARDVPAGADAQAALYRSLLAGRRVLVVLDNARDADQVRPLLPGAPGSLVLVTSRDRLTGLVVAEGAQPLAVGLPSPAEARQLLVRRLGAGRVGAEPEASAAVIARCARLPLALALAAARAAQTGFPLASLAAELADPDLRLDALSAGGAGGDLGAVFAWSYRTLSPDAARLFRLLGLSAGPDIGAAAAAALAGLPPARVRSLLAELTRASLLAEPVPGRYAAHDLLHAYAARLAEAHDTAADRRAARRRLLDHYTHGSRLAGRHVRAAADEQGEPPPATAGAVVPDIPDEPAALAWFETELASLLAAMRQAAGDGLADHTHHLAGAVFVFLDRRGLWHEWLALAEIALEVARQRSDPAREGWVERSLGVVCCRLGHLPAAEGHFDRALALYTGTADRVGLGLTQLSRSALADRLRRPAEALRYGELAYESFRAAGHVRGQGMALNSIGWFHAQAGDHRTALARCGQALRLIRAANDPHSEADTWDSLGYCHHQLGNFAAAAASYRRALAGYVRLGDRSYQADTLGRLGDSERAAGRPDSAARAWRQAHAILVDLGRSEAAAVQDKLAELRVDGVTSLTS